MDVARHVPPGRLRRLREELIEERIDVLDDARSADAIVDEIDYALRPLPHERRLPTYGAIVLPTVPAEEWAAATGLRTTLSRTVERDDRDVRRYADGLSSWAVRDADGVTALAVFDRPAGSERDVVVVAEATGAIVVQRRPDHDVRVAGPFGIARWDGSWWHVEPPIDSWLHRASCGLGTRDSEMLDLMLRFAVHDLGAAGIGALLILGGGSEGSYERRMATPPPLHLDRPTDLAPLRHVLSQVDGAAIFGSDGVLRELGVRLIPSAAAERTVDPLGGTRHTSGRRYSADDPTATVVAVSESGPVTVFRNGRIIGRSPESDVSADPAGG